MNTAQQNVTIIKRNSQHQQNNRTQKKEFNNKELTIVARALLIGLILTKREALSICYSLTKLLLVQLYSLLLLA